MAAPPRPSRRRATTLRPFMDPPAPHSVPAVLPTAPNDLYMPFIDGAYQRVVSGNARPWDCPVRAGAVPQPCQMQGSAAVNTGAWRAYPWRLAQTRRPQLRDKAPLPLS
ncbi:hypothetical protein TNCT6_35480 [Streptomyces sp. 6-11-2]|nr:hypothetical protein TNCT6_35480 [Streptomyces sp. 6-11-2]